MEFNEFCLMIQSNVNKLLSDQQITYILKCISDTGVVRKEGRRLFVCEIYSTILILLFFRLRILIMVPLVSGSF